MLILNINIEWEKNKKHLTNIELEKSYRLKELNNQNSFEYKSELEKLEEARDRIYHNIQRYEEILFRIDEALDMVKGHKYYDFIPMKYFNKMTYEAIAEKFDINVSSVYKAKNKILGSLEIHFLAQKLICYWVGIDKYIKKEKTGRKQGYCRENFYVVL